MARDPKIRAVNLEGVPEDGLPVLEVRSRLLLSTGHEIPCSAEPAVCAELLKQEPYAVASIEMRDGHGNWHKIPVRVMNVIAALPA